MSLAEANAQSWRELRSFLDESTDPRVDNWKNAVFDLLDQLATLGADRLFRAGQGMSHIMFSTKKTHRLDRSDPHVVVTVSVTGRTLPVEVAFGSGVWGIEGHFDIVFCPFDDARYEILKALARLWQKTKREPPPAEIAAYAAN
ncbi:MAG: hypothetical protein IT548_09920 [Alphaproteobacteria bacterium]|nr:hypothetical protein [Alphaproteobacteria bacterium]